MAEGANEYCLLGASVGPVVPQVCQEASLMTSDQQEEDNSEDVFVDNGVMSNISEIDLENLSVQLRNLGERVEEDVSMRGLTQDPALAWIRNLGAQEEANADLPTDSEEYETEIDLLFETMEGDPEAWIAALQRDSQPTGTISSDTQLRIEANGLPIEYHRGY